MNLKLPGWLNRPNLLKGSVILTIGSTLAAWALKDLIDHGWDNQTTTLIFVLFVRIGMFGTLWTLILGAMWLQDTINEILDKISKT